MAFNHLRKSSLGVLLALILGPAALLIFQGVDSPEIPFLRNHSPAAWIRYPEPLSCFVRYYTDETLFSKDFTLDQNPVGRLVLQVRALREARVSVNEFAVPPEILREKNWKQGVEVDISPWVKPGANTIRAEVRNPLGPALLWLRIDGLRDPWGTDGTWRAQTKSLPPKQAVLADDTQIKPDALTVRTPAESFREVGGTLLWFFIGSLGLGVIGHFSLSEQRIKNLHRVAFFGSLTVWAYLFWAKMLKIPPLIGFDVSQHLKYLLYMMENHRIPLATDGWSMFHPPLFYLLSLGMLDILPGGYPVLKIIPFLCGVGNVWVAYSLGRLVFRDDPVRIFGTVLFAGILPMNIYISAYVGPEPLHAFLSGASLLLTVHMLRSPEIKFSHMIFLGLFLGLALLTKITVWVISPLILIFLIYKLLRVEKKTFQEMVGKVGLLLLVPGAIAGWYYLRNILYLGRPIVVNWDLPGLNWWQDPGFHTLPYYLSFGEALWHPYLSGFFSFWDSIYATFWGDGLIAGRAFWDGRPEAWNYEYMSTVYLLALPAVGIFILGLIRALQKAFQDPKVQDRMEMAFLILILYFLGLFVLYGTMRIPIYSQPKAFYALAGMGPICVIFSLGLGTLHEWLSSPRLSAVRAIFYGWLGTLTAAIYLSFAA